MKICPKCKTVCDDANAYCTNCGEALPAANVNPAPQYQAPAPQAAPQPAQQPYVAPQPAPRPVPPQGNYYQAPPVYHPPVQKAEETISTGKWVGYQLIPLIPVAGGIIFLVMLFVWAFGTDKPTTFRNWAKSQLIFLLIGVILSVNIIIISIAVGVSLGNYISNNY